MPIRNERSEWSQSAHELADSRCFLWADASNFGQSGRVGAEHTFDGAEVPEQPVRDRRADTGQSLQQEQPPGGKALRLPVESAQDLLLPARLIGQKLQHSE